MVYDPYKESETQKLFREAEAAARKHEQARQDKRMADAMAEFQGVDKNALSPCDIDRVNRKLGLPGTTPYALDLEQKRWESNPDNVRRREEAIREAENERLHAQAKVEASEITRVAAERIQAQKDAAAKTEADAQRERLIQAEMRRQKWAEEDRQRRATEGGE